jgi:predicted ATPase/DNA-binding SARP family transcriptional activator
LPPLPAAFPKAFPFDFIMPQLTIRTLGPPELALDGVAVDTSRNKAIALLVYLAVNGQRCRREALAGLFWPEYEQSKAYAYLRRTLWELKEMLGDGWLEAERETVGLASAADVWLDVAAFRQALAATAGHGHAPAAVCLACVDALSRAAELYRGDFLAGFSLRDSPGFDDWQFYLAEGLRQEAGEALRKLSAIHGQERRLEAAIEVGRRWLGLDPLNEEGHRQVMLLLALNGQRSAALRQYQECARILQADMGIAPERKTTELFQRIEQGKVPSLASTAPPPATAPAPAVMPGAPLAPRPAHFNLPQLLTPFIGRERELAELCDLLAEPEVRLLTILAVGGMGKTRLAIETAARQGEFMDVGVVFVYLAPLQSPSALAPALLDALELEVREGTPAKAQVIDYLREKRLLLVLDNFEHLLDAASLVTEVLQAAPGVKVLATSRLPLGLPGEHRYHLAGMDFPSVERVDDTPDTSAVKLFVQGARQALPGFRLAGDDLRHVATICRLVEGMPLGILLAAGWVGLLSPQEIAAQMRTEHDFLETELHDVPERQRSMRLVMQQAWELLGEQERDAFASLSVLRGSFDRQAAQEISGAALRVLLSLVHKSMLIRLSDDQLAVHELLRQYGAERLSDDLDRFEATHDRHSALYCRRVQAWLESVKRPDRQLSMVDMENELENVRAAWNWAAIDHQIARLAATAEGMGLLLSWQGRGEYGESAFQGAADALTPPANDEEQVLLAYLLGWQALFASFHRSAAEVAALLDQAFDRLNSISQPGRAAIATRAFLLYMRGSMALSALDMAVSLPALEQSLALFERIGDAWWSATVLERLGSAAWTLNDLEQTNAYFQRSLAIRREIGDAAGTASLLVNLGALAGFDGGQVDQAVELYREASRLFASFGGRSGEMSSLYALQAAERLQGRFAEALQIVQRQLAISAELGDIQTLSDLRMTQGEILQLMGRYELAEQEHRHNVASVEASGWAAPETWMRFVFAAALLGRENYRETLQVLQPSLAALEQSHSKSMLGRSLAAASRAKLGLGDVNAAWQDVRRALDLLSGRHYFWLLEAMAAAAAVLAERSEVERAVEIYALLNRHEFVANARWFSDVFGQVVEKAAASLPPDTAAAAKVRGEMLDLWQATRELLVEYGASERVGG